jgi:hypothetical protein
VQPRFRHASGDSGRPQYTGILIQLANLHSDLADGDRLTPKSQFRQRGRRQQVPAGADTPAYDQEFWIECADQHSQDNTDCFASGLKKIYCRPVPPPSKFCQFGESRVLVKKLASCVLNGRAGRDVLKMHPPASHANWYPSNCSADVVCTTNELAAGKDACPNPSPENEKHDVSQPSGRAIKKLPENSRITIAFDYYRPRRPGTQHFGQRDVVPTLDIRRPHSLPFHVGDSGNTDPDTSRNISIAIQESNDLTYGAGFVGLINRLSAAPAYCSIVTDQTGRQLGAPHVDPEEHGMKIPRLAMAAQIDEDS